MPPPPLFFSDLNHLVGFNSDISEGVLFLCSSHGDFRKAILAIDQIQGGALVLRTRETSFCLRTL